EKVTLLDKSDVPPSEITTLLETIGVANLPNFYPVLAHYIQSKNEQLVSTTLMAMGQTMHLPFLKSILPFLGNKSQRKTTIQALQGFGLNAIPLLLETIQKRNQPMPVLRFIPMAIQSFNSQVSVKNLLLLLKDPDVTIRLEVIRSLSAIRSSRPELKFDRYKVVSGIYEECKLHHQTLAAMHTQIIISYRNRKKSKKEISDAEREARTSLLELLERRLDAGLERIFKLLGLRYQQKDVDIAYEGLLSNKQEAQTNAIEFLDNLLTGDLKRKLLPIIEDSALDVSSEAELQKIKHKIPSEIECFQLLLQENDLKVKLAVLYLIKQQKEAKYLPIIEPYLNSEDLKLRTFAGEAVIALKNV
ncbi:MAG: AAA family ATP:ADP antiporter, partial [Maribacter sp.]